MSSNLPDSEKIDSRKMYEDQRILDILEKRSLDQEKNYRDLYKRSRILQAGTQRSSNTSSNRVQQSDGIGASSSDSELDDLVNRIRSIEKNKKIAKTYTLTDPEYYQYLIRNNLDLVSNLTLETSCLLLCYPFNTLKTRLQAKHPLEDVCFFVKNKVTQYPLYRGIGQAMLSAFSGVFVNNAAFRWINLQMLEIPETKSLSTFQKQLIAFAFADIFATPFRLPFEVRKIFLQMNAGPISFDKYMNSMKAVLLPSILRDFSYRIGFNTVFQLCLHGQSYAQMYSTSDPFERDMIQRHIDRAVPTQNDYNKRITGMILGSLAGILLSNPFDLVVTRLIVQQYLKYNGFIDCLKMIKREEKISKMLFAGYWARSSYYMISGSVIFNFYDVFRSMLGEAYAY